MKNNCYDPYDERIKGGLDALAAEIPVPNVTKAFERHKRRRGSKDWVRSVVAVLAVMIVFGTAIGGSVDAFRGLIKITIARVLSETSQLFQRSDEGSVGPINDFLVKEFESLSGLKQEQATRIFIPSGLSEESFDYAEVVYNSNTVRRLALEFSHSDKPLRLVVISTATSARAIDIEDFSVQTFISRDTEITSFSDDQGFTLLEWDRGHYTFELSGYMPAEELLSVSVSLGLFN